MVRSVFVKQGKVGPINEWYVDGEWRDVKQENQNGVRQLGLADLDNSYNGHIRMNYVSDPVTVIRGDKTVDSHEELKEFLQQLGCWDENVFTPVRIANSGDWKYAYKTLPENTKLGYKKVKTAVERLIEDNTSQFRQTDLLEGETEFNIMVPQEFNK